MMMMIIVPSNNSNSSGNQQNLNSILSGRSPPLYYKLKLIAMQGHQTKTKIKQKEGIKSNNMQ